MVAFLVAAALNGCTSWRVQPVSPEQLLSKEHPEAVRVQRADSSRIVLNSPQLVADSLVGTTHGRPAGVAVADITAIAVRRGNAVKTTGLIVGILATTIVALVAACEIAGCDLNRLSE